MAQNIRLVEYFYVSVPDKPGGALDVLRTLRDERINLLALAGFPEGRKTQLDLVPADSAAFRNVARRNKWKLTGPKRAFLIEGTGDRPGIVSELSAKLSDAKINVIAATFLGAPENTYSGILWVPPAAVKKAAQVLGAKALGARPTTTRYAPEPEQPQAT